jgi:DNA polymerase-3 subunit delta
VSCFLFLGPELGDKQDAIKELRLKLTQGTVFPEETTFYAGETPISKISSVLLNSSLFAEKRLFFIKNAELIKEKSEIEFFASYIASGQKDTAVVLISDNNSLVKALEDKVPRENKRVFYEYFENKKIEWLRSYFRREMCTVTDDAIGTILEMVENNTEALKRECSRLIFFLKNKKEINSADVEEWLSHSREESAFTLFSRIASGDLSRSLESLHSLLAVREKPRVLFAGLAWCFRKLRDYISLMDSGETSDFEFKKIGLGSPKIRRDYEQAFRRYDAAGTDRCLALIARYDVLTLAGGDALECILMELFIYHLITDSK